MNVEQVVREVTVRGSVQGMDQVARAYDQVTAAAGRTATVTDITTKAQISAEAAVEKLRLQYQDGYRQQQKFTDAQQTYQRAVDQGRISQAAAAAEIANIQAKLGQLSNTQKATGVATQNLQFQMASLAGGMGLFGQVLSMLGPWGFAAAVGFGAISAAINHMESEAARMADKANEMRAFAETTGLSITQLKALGRAGAEFGVGTDTIAAAVEKFTVAMEDARQKTGPLYDAVRQIDGGLANELASAKTTAQAWDVLGKARAAASDQSKNALSKTAFGKGGLDVGLVLDATEQSGGLDVIINRQQKLNGLTDDQIKKWGITKTQIDEAQKRTANLMASTYTQEVLDRQLQAALLEERITRAIIAGTAERRKSVSGQYDALGNYTPGATAPQSPIEAATSSLAAGLNAGQKPDLSGYDAQRKAIESVTAAVKSGIDEDKARRDAAIGDANQTKERVAYLGSAATAEERASARIKDLTASLLQNKISQEDYNRAVASVDLDKSAALIGARVSALGASATVTDLLAQKEVQLAQARQQGAGLSTAQEANQRRLVVEQANGVGAINAQIDAVKVQSATLGMSVGDAAAYSAVQTKMNEAIRAGAPLNAQQEAQLRAAAAALGAKTQAAAQDAAQAHANFDLQTVGLSDIDKQIAQVQYQLHGDGWQNFMHDGLAATMRLTDSLKTMVDYTNSFGQSLTQAFAAGKSGNEALSAAVGALGTKMSSDLMSKASTNIVSGIKTGDMSQVASGGLNAIAGIGISLLQGEAAKAKQAQADFKAAQDAWTAMAGEVTKFKDQMLGTNTGSLGGAISDATDKAQSYADAAHKAGQATGDLTSVLATYIQRMTRDFMNTFDTTIEALNEGLGMDSPAVKAAANVKGIGDTLKGFIDDTVKAGQGLGTAAPAIAAATASSQSYALSLLQTPPVLTTVQTALLTLRGNAQQLQTTLQDLGMSAGDAGAAISTGIKAALAGISTTFAQSLQAQINSASGKDYINQINALLTQGASNLSDAQSLGMDPTLVVQAFQAQAQAIVDSAGLVGDAFDDFIDQFPELAGVVNQSATAIKSLSDATTQFYASLRTTISTYLHGLNVGTQSALSPQDRLSTAQSDYSAQLAKAQGGDRDAIGSITQYSNDLLSAAKDYFASSAGYADILNKVQTQLAALPDAAAANDPVVEQLKQVAANTSGALATTGTTATNTGNTVATLAALQSIQAATQASSVNISASMTQLGAQGAYVAAAQGSQYFGPMNSYLAQIVTNTALSGQAAAKPDSGSVWWNPFTWFAEGGSVTGGTPGKDSVMAMLTPNEFVVKPGPATDYLPLLQAMNAGMLPPLQHFANGGMVMPVSVQMPMISAAYGISSGSAAGNDNGQHFSDLGNTLVRAMAGASMAEITAMREEMALLRADVARLTDAVKGNKPKAPQAGTRSAA